MADEAVVENLPVNNRFFCYKCNLNIDANLSDYTCPNCGGGFIERLDDYNENDEEDEMPMEVHNDYTLFDRRGHIRAFRGRSRVGNRRTDTNHVGPFFLRPSRSIRGGRVEPLLHETLLQDFILNVTEASFGADGSLLGAPVRVLLNPGDYAWGREGLDAIVTQLLNQMDATGPPPLAKDKINEIPVVSISKEQADTNIQCSVCWEDFKVDESVRKLPCEHIYHESCIVPWLELHGTCPICRKMLSDENHEAAENTANVVTNSLAALFRAARTAEAGTSTSSSISSNGTQTTPPSSSQSSQTSTASTSSRPDFDFNEEYEMEFD